MAYPLHIARATRQLGAKAALVGMLGLAVTLLAPYQTQSSPLLRGEAGPPDGQHSLALAAAPSGQAALRKHDAPILLDGHSLTIPQVVKIAREETPVVIASAALERVEQSFALVLAANQQGLPIYGLNRGVGLNKDQTILSGPLDDETRRLSERFNGSNLRTTSAGVGPEVPEDQVRATMLIRLNTMLAGQSGAQPRVAELYRDFLNHRIHPILPSRASVGEADITILSHIGLAMMGEEEVIYAGRRMPAADALAEAGLAPLVPFGKDSLAIMSSNAYAAAIATMAAYDAAHLLDMAVRVFALSLEGLNGNVAPFLPAAHAVRPYGAQGKAAAAILAELEGSYLWQVSAERALQDPLSFRTASQVFGAADEALATLQDRLLVQLNTSDDNPAVIPWIVPPPGAGTQVDAYYVNGGTVYGAVIPTANFEPLLWVLPLQSLNVALNHVSRASAARTTRLGTPEFTHLSRFLAPDDVTLAYSAIQKVYGVLDAENQALSRPVSTDFLPLAGDIEDTATNAASAARNSLWMIDNLYYMLGIELMHAAQAVDLRSRAAPGLSLGRGTAPLLAAFRQGVPFLDADRPLTRDIAKAYGFLRGPQRYD